MRTAAASATVLVAMLGGSAAANDSTFGGTGAELIPLAETRIRMASEEIVLERDAEGWRIEARYVFENPTDDEVAVEMGFPERHCDPDEDCASGAAGHFKDLQTTVRGVAVTQRSGKVAADHDWAPKLGKVWLYSLALAPHERVEIVHRYGYDPSTSVEGESIDYVTRTGKLWNGPIGSARFVVRTFERPWMLEFPPEFVLVGFEETPGGLRRGVTEMVFEMKEWTPSGDFQLLMANPHRGMENLTVECPELFRVVALERDRTSDPKAAAALDTLLDAYDAATLRVCRNVPFAAHGRRFASKKLRARFYGPDVRVAPSEQGSTRVRVGMRENPSYRRGLLTNDELLYVRALARAR